MEYVNLSTDAIVSNAISRLNEYSGLSFLTPGSKARALIEILGEELSLQATEFDQNIGSNFIRKASGQMLDFIGEVYGTRREKEKKAIVLSQEENFKLYTLEESFGSINANNPITIPKGTLAISNTPAIGSDTIIYVNTTDIFLPKESSEVFFSAEAIAPGAFANVGARSLQYHNFTNYADSLNNTLSVLNIESITYGKDEETDQNYRFRIQQERISQEAGNYSSIRLALLGIPGIADVKRIKYERGVGTSDWLIQSTTPVVSASLIAEAQKVIDAKQSSGTSNKARSPVTVGVEMMFSITYKRSLEDSQKEQIKSVIRQNIANYVNTLPIGGSLVQDQIVRIVLTSSNEIQSMGDANSRDNFSYLYAYRRSAISNSVTRKTLMGDYVSRYDEKVILEPTINAPIKIRDNN
jgi:uncharacterized phage protein gp47/JayE